MSTKTSLYSFGNKLYSVGRYDEAIAFFAKCREEYGDVKCAFGIARAYHLGQGAQQDYDKADDMLRAILPDLIRLYAVDADQEAADMLEWYVANAGVRECATQPQSEYAQLPRIELRRRAISKDDVLAMMELADRWHEDEDYEEAYNWYDRASDEGHAPAMVALGRYAQLGYYVEEDPEEAAYYYRRAAVLGDAEGMYQYGLMLYNSALASGNPLKQAIEWWEKAAKQDHPAAQYMLGWCYQRGVGKRERLTMAVKLYTEAAKQGDKDAQNALGDMYATGNKIIGIDTSTAMLWYLMSAMQGNDDAMCGLAQLFIDRGEKDVAKYWLERAIEEDSDRARDMLASII